MTMIKMPGFEPVSMDDGVESQAVSPRGREVSDVDVGVLGGGLLGPPEQGLLGGNILLSNNNV